MANTRKRTRNSKNNLSSKTTNGVQNGAGNKAGDVREKENGVKLSTMAPALLDYASVRMLTSV
jgi:hypothetical protein